MGHSPINRRDFFRTLTLKKEQPSGDPLFDKYSRKSLGPRTYRNELVSFAAEQEAPNSFGAETLRVGNVTSGLNTYTGTWGTSEALHLLRRTGFGFKKAHLDTLLAAGSASAAADIVLHIDNTVPAPPVNWYNNIFADEGGLAYGADCTTTAFNSSSVGQTSNVYRKEGLRRWLMGLSLNQDISIREKMVMFWYHFIPVDFDAVYQSSNTYVATNSARICYDYMKMFRDAATGNFKTLIRNMATQPAMMFYLNNHANTATAPDENFARELMELFTLGKDPLSQYTQDDVVAAAKVLTGWRVQNLNLNTTATAFDSTKHSTGSKVFSSFFNTTIPYSGSTEIDALINMIFSKQQVVSEYICRRLYRYFVYYDIDANIEATVITPLAQVFVSSNWDILPVLQKLFKSEHFYDMANRGVYIKSPLDLVVGSLRCFNLNHNVSDPLNYQAQYMLWSNFLDSYTLPMEQRYGQMPNVSGWNAFYQTPAYHEYWINTNTIQKRFYWLSRIFDGYSYTNNNLTTTIKVDVIAWVQQQFPNATIQDPNLLVSACINVLLPIDLSQAKKDSIKQQTLLYQQITDSYWTTAWAGYISNGSTTIVKDRLKNLLYTLVQLAEFQLM